MRAILMVLLAAAAAHAEQFYTVAIGAGQAVSTAVRVIGAAGQHNGLPASLQMPAAWTPADLLVEASYDGGATWLPVYDSDGGRPRIKVDAGRAVVLDASVLWALPRIRFRSVAAGGTADVAQAAQRTMVLVVR